MQGNGAVLLYDNAAQRGTFIDDGRIDEPGLLLTDQLAPAASFPGFTVMEWQWGSAESIDAVALWGTSQVFLINAPTVSVERWTGSAWEDIPGSLLVAEPSAFQPAHLVFIFDATVETTRLRVTPLATSEILSVGAVQIAKMLRHPALVDSGWSTDYQDIATKDASDGGQIYASAGKVSRRFSIAQTVLPAEVMYGIPRRTEVALGAPDILTGFSAASDTYTLAAAIGEIAWTDVLDVGLSYVLSYDSRAFGVELPFGNFPALNIANPFTWLSLGHRSIHFTATSSDLSLVAQAGGESVFQVGSILLEQANIAPASPAERRSMSDLIAISGTSKPVGLIIRPSTPIETSFLTAYGLLDSIQPYTDQGEGLTAGGFAIVESLG
jgi:hypothetical protein